MPKIPDDWRNEIKSGEGFISPFEVEEWLRDEAPQEVRDAIAEGMERGLSLDWSLLAADVGASTNPNDWDSVVFHYNHGTENWDVELHQKDGSTYIIDNFDDDYLIWADLYALLDADYPDVEVDKEYEAA